MALCLGVPCGQPAGILTYMGEAEAAGVLTCMAEALATGSPLLKLGAWLLVVATLYTTVLGMVAGPVLS